MDSRAAVVGSGPNGLAAAITLARAGLDVTVYEGADSVGGGLRSAELTEPGLIHDECAAFHPLVLASRFYRENDFGELGLRFAAPPVQYAHPLDGARGGAAYQSVERTAHELGADGKAWNAVFAPVARRFDSLSQDIMGPVAHVPRHPLLLANFGARAATPASVLTKVWSEDPARALFAGAAAHALRPLDRPFSSAIGVALGAAAHAYGWPVVVGGSGQLASVLSAKFRELGGTIVTNAMIHDLRELDSPDLVLLDTSPSAAARISGNALPARTHRAYTRYRHGPGVFKVDFAVSGAVPWAYPPARSAGTVHLGGSFEETGAAERAVCRGEMPARPFVLVGQQALADPTRAVHGLQPIYAYAHVPHAYEGDATQAIIEQIERFAPGFRDSIAAVSVKTTTELARRNPNYVGGDVTTGANTVRQLAFRPYTTLRPYSTGAPGIFLCSAATPPGAGAHGMAGYNAARAALSSLSKSRAAELSPYSP